MDAAAGALADTLDVESPVRHDMEFAGVDLSDGDKKQAPRPAQIPSGVKQVLTSAAIGLTVMTYYEDAIRAITMWDEQTDFIAKHAGVPSVLAKGFLLIIMLIQLTSITMIIPPTCMPAAAKLIIAVCAAVAASVLAQPLLFNQLTNIELLTMSCAQIGAIGACGIICSPFALERSGEY